MSETWVQPIELGLAAARLVPLKVEHAAALAVAAASHDTFRYFSRGPSPLTELGMGEFVEYLLGPAQTVPFCVIDPATNMPVGITTYLDIRPAHGTLEIGWTWYSPAARGSRVNPACKLLLLSHAFESLGAHRVSLKTDQRNAQSRAAILKLGATFEGIMRENVLMPDGFRRSTAMYSLLAEEWGGVRQALEARLG